MSAAPPELSVRLRVLVGGRVQGVSFRAHTAAHARRLGVTGWVQNLAGGEVELEAQGAETAVAALVDTCRTGPPYARVDDVSVEVRPVIVGERTFEIR